MTIHLRIDEFAHLAAARGHRTYEQQATSTRVGIATIHRLRNGGPADSRTIAKILTAYGVGFDDLFAIKSDTAAAA
ncbi:hypothetical protein ACFXPI_11195 [Streptomyces sp. NPDC059104]|uniref:hypothetical protein n=1 Tax=Streptomyces TaxID=1883 RepID=UPI0031EBD053